MRGESSHWPKACQVLSKLILTAFIQKKSHHLHFADEKTEAQKPIDLASVRQQERSSSEILKV